VTAVPAVETSRLDGVLTLRMNRPEKRNALDRAMYAALASALSDADADAAVGAALIAGVPGAFSAGNDIRDFAAVGSGETGAVDAIRRFLHALVGFGKPLVAAVDGLAVGIGTTMLMHCDLVFASPESTFRTPFVDLGLVPEAASSLVAPRLMGHQAAFALLVAGETLSAEAAKEARLVHRIAPSVEAEAAAAARALAVRPREAVRLSRDLLRGSREEILARIEAENRLFAERLRSPEAQAAFARFLGR
jgi:enoyl-CoA hydratase/carnithine racemase